MQNVQPQIVEIIKHSQRILIMPSAPADGDSLGSALALYLVLKKLNKEVTVVSTEPIPEAFQFLPTTNVISNEFSAASDFIVTIDCHKAKVGTIRTKLEQDKVNIILTAKSGQFAADQVSFHHGPSKYDIIITVDTGDLSQLGRFYEDNTELFSQIPVINIDHHASNDYFGRINLVDIMSSATTELLIPIIEELERQTNQKLMDEDVATLLLAGIITDTGSFQNANTTPKSFASAAYLVRHGARQQEIIQHVFKTKRLSTLRLWGRILSRLTIDPKLRFVWSTINRKDFEETQSRDDETGGIIDELLTNAPGTEVVLLLKEKEGNIVSGSIRTTSPSVDASKIAQMFGGGGHVQAAGFKIESANFDATMRMVIEKIKNFQKERLFMGEEEEPQVAPQKVETLEAPVPDLAKLLEKYLGSAQVPEQNIKEPSKIATPEQPSEKVLGKPTSPTKKSKKEPPQAHKEKITPATKKTAQTTKEKETETTFTDIIIRKNKNEEAELEPGITYKFEE